MHSNSTVRDHSTERYFFEVEYHTNESRRRIEEAVNQVAEVTADICAHFDSLVSPGHKLLKDIQKSDYRWSEGTEKKIFTNYLSAEENLRELRGTFLRKEDAAVRDPNLYGPHESRVVDGYRNCAQSVGVIIEILQEIRWAVMERSEDLDEIVRKESAEDFLASIG